MYGSNRWFLCICLSRVFTLSCPQTTNAQGIDFNRIRIMYTRTESKHLHVRYYQPSLISASATGKPSPIERHARRMQPSNRQHEVRNRVALCILSLHLICLSIGGLARPATAPTTQGDYNYKKSSYLSLALVQQTRHEQRAIPSNPTSVNIVLDETKRVFSVLTFSPSLTLPL